MVRKVLITVLFTTWCICIATGQDLYGEGNVEQVKLVWIPKTWPAALIGWDLKRKKDSGKWVKLNKEIIKPYISAGKSLASATNSTSELNRLTTKLSSLMSSGRLKEKGQDEFLKELKTADGRFGVAFLSAMDFDLALIMGFGFVDKDFKGEGNYQYGLFQQFNDGREPKLVAEFSWKYGTEPKLKVPMKGEVKKYGSKGNELVFTFQKAEFEAINPLGVNVYRKEEHGQFVKLNKRAILVNAAEENIVFTYLDKGADQTKSYTYALAPVTVFQTEGSKVEFVYNPEKTNANIEAPSLKDPVISESSLTFEWDFKEEHEEFIKGFYVQLKENEGFDFHNVSELLPASVRLFNYHELPKQDGEYYHFKVIALKNDNLELWSNRKVFYNKKVTKPSAPENLKAEIITSGDDYQVKLTWSPPAENAEFVQEYNIYTSSPNQERVVKEGSIGSITENEYIYSVYRDRAATYNFAISALNNKNEESLLTDKVQILVPSKSLPFINIWPISKEGRRITLDWEYDDDIADLAGFRLFQNNVLIADEAILNATTRQWVSAELEPGEYSYEIMAVTLTDVQSERSDPRKFKIE